MPGYLEQEERWAARLGGARFAFAIRKRCDDGPAHTAGRIFVAVRCRARDHWSDIFDAVLPGMETSGILMAPSGGLGRSGDTLFLIMTLESRSIGIVRVAMKVYSWPLVFFTPIILGMIFAVANMLAALSSIPYRACIIPGMRPTSNPTAMQQLGSIEARLAEMSRQRGERAASLRIAMHPEYNGWSSGPDARRRHS